MTKTALVTGAAGHCGTFMVRLLGEKGYNVIATDLAKQDRDDLFLCGKWTADDTMMEELCADANITYIQADLTDKESLKPLFEHDIDVVFSIASLYDYFALIDILRKINVGGVRNLAELAAEKGVTHFIHWSTCGVYGEPKYEKDEKGYALPADETAPYDPPNAYSISKKEQEQMLFELHKNQGLSLTLIRPAPIYGPWQTYGAWHIFNLIHKIGTCVVPSMYPRKKRLRVPMVHVQDLVQIALFLYEYKPKEKVIGEAYNGICDCGFQDEYIEFLCEAMNVKYSRIPVWWPFYKAVAKLAMWVTARQENRARKKGVRPRFEASMAGYLNHQYYFSNQKIKNLGYKFIYPDFKKGVLETLQWYKEMGWLEDDIDAK